MKIKSIAVCSLCIALASVLSMIKLYQFPFGGSVTLLSMLVITLPAWIYGFKTGTLTGFLYGMVQFALGPTVISIPQVILDYVLAFTVMGVAGLMKNKKNSLVKGYSLAVVARWAIATLAGLAWVAVGTTAWEGWNPILYSMVYNGAYIFAEAILTLAIISMSPMRKALERVREQVKE